MYSILDEAPAELINDIALVDGVLVCSDVRKSDQHFLSFISRARRRGITQVKFLPAQEFAKRYGSMAHQSRAEVKSKIQNYGIRLLQAAYDQNASDIHLADYGTYGVIQFRCMGMLREYTKLTGNQIQSLISVIYGTFAQQGNTTSFVKKTRQDARIVNREFLPQNVRSVRVHTEPLECLQSEPGTLMALRLLYDRTEAKGGLEDRMKVLGYEEKHIANFRYLTERTGLTIISGPTGSGKSTMLKHFMEAQAEETPTKAYMSIEDPPEYTLSGVNQTTVSTNDQESDFDPAKRGRAFANAIAGAMRSDPDVIMIGEIRYPEAAKGAIDAALTGHGVTTTLHANNAMGIISRMVSLLKSPDFSDPLEYLCDHNVMAGLIYQRLVPVLCPQCKLPLVSSHKTPEDKKHIEEVLPKYTSERLFKILKDLDTVHVLGRGCEHCKQVGFVRQTVAAEVIVTNEDLLSHLRRGDSAKASTCWLKDMGGKTYVQHAIEGISRGELDPHHTEIRLGVPLDFTRGLTQKAVQE